MQQIFLAQTRNRQDHEWLQAALAPNGQVVEAGATLDELLGLLDVTGSGLVFVSIDRDNLVTQCGMIESLLETRPMLVVVALGDGLDNQLVLNAMRAGARDFIAYGSRSSEVQGLVRRIGQRLPQLPPQRDLGEVTLLYGTRPDADGALLASHLALKFQASGQRTLLIDLGLPSGDSLEILGLNASFYFSDALRNLRRLDASLIASAFCREADGLRILAMGEDGEPLEQCSTGVLYLLMGSLRQHFQQVLVNVCGQPDSDALRVLVGNSSRLLWCANQSVPDCRRNLAQLNRWRGRGVNLEHARLLVDRYLPNVAPSKEDLGRTFEMPLAGALQLSPATRLNVKNQGRSLFKLAPRDALSQELAGLAARLLQKTEGTGRRSWWQRLLRSEA